MNEFKNAFEGFQEIAEGHIVQAHSGPSGQGETICHSVRDWYNADEIDCEQSWANHCDSESLDLLLTVEDILEGDETAYTLEAQCHTSYTNGNFKQFIEQHEALEDGDDFLTYLGEYYYDSTPEEHKQYIAILEHLIRNT